MIENEMTVSVPLEVVKASEIEPKEVKWLWYPYIPFGKVTLLQGDPGDGKSKLTYENMNVIEERIPFNVHFKTPTAPTYMEQLKQMETDGLVSLRGLRKDATIFNEIVIDVNTMYFERNGGYEYAKQFYEEAFHFIEEKFGAENVISAVMHADEINIAATEELGKEVYHYHLHAMVLPVVEKEILWSKRCKDEKLRGTVKEVVNQISHSKNVV